MRTATPADSAKIRAAELLGKSVGLFKDVVESKRQRSPEEIKKELDRRLSMLEDSDGTDMVH